MRTHIVVPQPLAGLRRLEANQVASRQKEEVIVQVLSKTVIQEAVGKLGPAPRPSGGFTRDRELDQLTDLARRVREDVSLLETFLVQISALPPERRADLLAR